MKITTTYLPLNCSGNKCITVETTINSKTGVWNNPGGESGEWCTWEEGKWVPDPMSNRVKISGPFPADILLEIVAWEQAGQPADAKPEVLKTSNVIWTEIS